MSGAQDGGPAFPLQSIGPDFAPGHAGMSLRDHFASAALTGYFAAPHTPHQGAANAEVAAYMYAMADAMLAARAKGLTAADAPRSDDPVLAELKRLVDQSACLTDADIERAEYVIAQAEGRA